MMQPHHTLLDSLELRFRELGFRLLTDETHGRDYSRSDGFRLVVTLERYGESFSVTLVPPGQQEADGLVAAFLMQAVDPAAFRNAVGYSEHAGDVAGSILHWWNVFLEFLGRHSEQLLVWPMPKEVKRRYETVCQAKMNQLGGL
jgi:hypothetical protein